MMQAVPTPASTSTPFSLDVELRELQQLIEQRRFEDALAAADRLLEQLPGAPRPALHARRRVAPPAARSRGSGDAGRPRGHASRLPAAVPGTWALPRVPAAGAGGDPGFLTRRRVEPCVAGELAPAGIALPDGRPHAGIDECGAARRQACQPGYRGGDGSQHARRRQPARGRGPHPGLPAAQAGRHRGAAGAGAGRAPERVLEGRGHAARGRARGLARLSRGPARLRARPDRPAPPQGGPRADRDPDRRGA